MSDSDESAPVDPTGTVLCIEDNAVSMKLVEAMLALYPEVRLLKAYTASEGIRLAQEQRPDVVLLDMHLPDMSGLDVVRALSEQISRSGLNIVLLTADTFSVEVVKAMSLGAKAYWPKPLTLERVRSGLGRLLTPRHPSTTASTTSAR